MDTINNNNILLSTENLCKNFQGIQAVQNVNFKLPKNEIRALIGPNGAGKTTFVSLLCGRIKSTEGQVFFNGENISKLPVYSRISGRDRGCHLAGKDHIAALPVCPPRLLQSSGPARLHHHRVGPD